MATIHKRRLRSGEIVWELTHGTGRERQRMVAGRTREEAQEVLKQFERFYDHVGGFGHLLVAGQSGFLSHVETVHGITMLSREVFPKLRDRYPDTAISGGFRHKDASVQSTAIPI